MRDLLLGLRPKDFDVATNATPEQVKSLFRRAFIIGRRFRIVHVMFGRGREHEVIEVSTFRAYMDNAAAEAGEPATRSTSKSELAGMKHAVDASGRVLRDNVWGPQDEDAARRDFTINAMYYDPETPDRGRLPRRHRGREEAAAAHDRRPGHALPRGPGAHHPRGALRRQAGALGFKIEPKTEAPLMPSLAAAGRRAAEPPVRRDAQAAADRPLAGDHRAAEDAGHGARHLSAARRGRRARRRSPSCSAALQDTDRRVGEGKPVAPSFLLACVLWSDVRDGWAARAWRTAQHPFPALQDAIDDVFDARIGDISGRGKLAADMREIWMMQPRFEKRTGSTPFSLVEQPRFRAGFDFMRLRADVGEVDVVLADWWQEFSQASDAVREDLMAQLRDEQQKGSSAARARCKPQAQAAEGEARPPPAREPRRARARRRARRQRAADGDGGDAPRKRRRRRRKPAAGRRRRQLRRRRRRGLSARCASR